MRILYLTQVGHIAILSIAEAWCYAYLHHIRVIAEPTFHICPNFLDC